MATGIIRLDQFFKEKRVKSKSPTEREWREWMDMQRQHEQAVEELDRQIPPSNRKFVFTR